MPFAAIYRANLNVVYVHGSEKALGLNHGFILCLADQRSV